MGRFGEMKRILQILPLLFWLGCADNSSTGTGTGWIHPFAGTWKVTDYCVYESANCDSNCNNQEFIPIFAKGGWPLRTSRWSYVDGRVITIDENGDAGGGINFSQSQQNFTVGTNGYSWSPFPGITNNVSGFNYFSGTCILNDDKNTLKLIYNKNAVCMRSRSEDWDGFIDGWFGEYVRYQSDSIECYDRWIITTHTDFGFTYNDTTYYYETWFPEYCAKITLTKQ